MELYQIKYQPCPFCGNDSKLGPARKIARTLYNGFGSRISWGRFYIRCHKCNARGPVVSGFTGYTDDAVIVNGERCKVYPREHYYALAAQAWNAMTDAYEPPEKGSVEITHCMDCIYYHKPHVEKKDGTECDISEVPEEYKPIPSMCNSDFGINVGGKCEYDNRYAPYEDDKTVFRCPDDYCSRGRRADNG